MIYAARPIWQTDGSFPRWGIPEWAANFRDLRTLDECALAGRRDGDRSGLGLYIPIEGATIKDAAAIPLGELDDVLTGEQKTAMNVSMVRTLREAIVQKILFSDSPPTLRRGGKIEVSIGPERIIIPMAPGTDGFSVVQAKTKAGILAAPPEKYGALITDRLEKLGVEVTRENAALYLGLDIEPGPKQTTKGDTFDGGASVKDLNSRNSTGPNGGDSWTKISGLIEADVTAQLRAYYSGSTACIYRLNADMSSGDMACEVDVRFQTAVGGKYAGTCVRKDSGATNTYFAAVASPDRSPAKLVIAKRLAGTYTDIATVSETFSAGSYTKLRLEVIGEDLELFWGGVSKLTGSDSTSMSGLRGLIDGNTASASEYVTLQNFLVTDELGGTIVNTPDPLAIDVALVAPTTRRNSKPSALSIEATIAATTVQRTVTPAPLATAITLAAPAMRRIVRPDPLVISLAVIDPASGAIQKPDPLAMSLAIASPAVRRIVKPAPVVASITTASPTVRRIVKPAPLSLYVTVVSPTSGEAETPDPLAMSLAIASPVVRRIVKPAPIVVALSIATPTARRTVRPAPLSIEIALVPPDGETGAYRIYKRTTIDGADTLIATISSIHQQQVLTGFSNESVQWIHVKAVSRCGVEDAEPIRLKLIAFDADGNLILPVPSAPLGLRLDCGADGLVTARWTYLTNGQGAAPALFNVYVAVDADEIDLLNPTDTVTFSAARNFILSLGTFDHDQVVKVIVRSEAASGAEERNEIEVSTTADAQAPTPATAMQVEVVAS